MAKVGYIYMAAEYEGMEADKTWMQEYGCCRIIEEEEAREKTRPEWKALLMSLDRGDELVVSKFSNAVRGTRELSVFLEFCRVKVVRVISIHDYIDSKNELFPDTKPSDVLELIGSLPAEIAVMRKASAHVSHLRQVKSRIKPSHTKEQREMTIINMYNSGHAIDDIWRVSGFKSRSSVFRILNKYHVTFNRGPHSGPIKKRGQKTNNDVNGEE